MNRPAVSTGKRLRHDVSPWVAPAQRDWEGIDVGPAEPPAHSAIAWTRFKDDLVALNPSRWMLQQTPLHTVLSFLNTTKYPPSLLFLLMTLGPALLFLRAVDGGTPKFLRPTLAFGRVPLFYYVLHFTLIHALAVLVCYGRYDTAHWLF